MAVTIENCVKSIICGLSTAVQNALRALLNAYIAQFDVLIAGYEAKLIYLNILTAPVQVVAGFVEAAIQDARAGANLIPFDLAEGCIGIGDINLAIQDNLNAILASAINIETDLNRMLSFKDEVEAAIADVKRLRDLYVALISTIDTCTPLVENLNI